MTRKKQLIKQLKESLNPDNRPEVVVFWDDTHGFLYNDPHRDLGPAPEGYFYYEGKMLSKAECLKVPAKRQIFVTHKGGLYDLPKSKQQ